MQVLYALVAPFVSILAHRAGPESLPASRFLLGLVICLHLAVYVLGMKLLHAPMERALALPLLDTITQTALFTALLFGLGLRARLMQTLTAVFGVDVLLNLISVPLAMLSRPASDSVFAVIPAVAAIVLMLWSLGVKGHILKHAAGFPYFVGVVIALAFFVAFYALDSVLFGAAAG